MNKKKIINDPIYGFVSIQHDILFDCIEQPEFQRLRRIKQLGLTHLVYPGALHTRFQHAIGAMHLMTKAIESLRSKSVAISEAEERAALLAILLHDIGHGPFSHSLENSILNNVHHESISQKLMEVLRDRLGDDIDQAIRIFKGQYEKQFLHQLVSSQLDMDRLDYLRRDSFYTGVSEGTIGIERIIQMLNVHEDELVVDEKGVYSIEKFIMARRFMYWQVYLHKTSLAADQLMLSILRRAKSLIRSGAALFASPYLFYFLKENPDEEALWNDEAVLDHFILLDDSDIISAIKVWQFDEDPILSRLCMMLINRRLPKIEIRNEPIPQDEIQSIQQQTAEELSLALDDAQYFVYHGNMSNTTYSGGQEQIKILYKDGRLNDLATSTETYGVSAQDKPTMKYFVCYPK